MHLYMYICIYIYIHIYMYIQISRSYLFEEQKLIQTVQGGEDP